MDSMGDWQLDDSLTEDEIRAAMAKDGMRPVDALTSKQGSTKPAARSMGTIAIREWASAAGFEQNTVATYRDSIRIPV